jgi:hypothetical protein
MIQWLRRMFENQERAERYNISKTLFACKLAEGSPVSPDMIKMMGYIETLTNLGCEIKNDLTTDVILQSLPVSYESFIMNFYMNGMEKTIAKLHGMLKTAKDKIKKNSNHVMMVQKEKKKGKCWTPPKGKDKEKVFDEPSSFKPKIKKTSLALLLMRNASTTTIKDIDSETVRSTWRSRRRIREVRLPLQV